MVATQYDVARLTGLSQATISRALKGDNSVTPETRSRILEACQVLGYRPSVGGRMLAEGQRAIIGISLSHVALPTDRYVTLMHQALLKALGVSGYGVVMLAPENLAAELPNVGAVVLVGVGEDDPRIALCNASLTPFVAIGYAGESETFSVVPDDAEGARLVARHFHALGRKSMVIMSSYDPGETPAMQIRAKSSQAEAGKLGLQSTRLHALESATSTLSGYRTARQAEALLRGADCLFCDTDEHALGAIEALGDLGLRVPQDITVVGFDDLPGLSAKLTTVRQDFLRIAQAAIELRAEALAGYPTKRIVVPVELVVRET